VVKSLKAIKAICLKNVIILFVLFFVQCKNHDNEKASESYFKAEIDGRIKRIQEIKIHDSTTVDPIRIDEEINKLLLLSKDIENLSASINKSKQFFDSISIKLSINRADFTDINKEMTLEEIATALKGNELNLFNQILFKNSKGESLMYTAQ